MKAATLRMKAGLIAHSTETVAMTAVTSAGIAATSENSTTRRVCSREPARAARARRAQFLNLHGDEDEQDANDDAVADKNAEHDIVGGDDRGEAREDDEGRERQPEARADRPRPKTPGYPAFRQSLGENDLRGLANRGGSINHGCRICLPRRRAVSCVNSATLLRDCDESGAEVGACL